MGIFNVPLINTRFRNKLTIEDRILQYLSGYIHLRDHHIAPEDITQEGIRRAVPCDHAYISRVLESNVENGYIIRKLARVKNKNRKQYIYLLSDNGLKYVQELNCTVNDFKPIIIINKYEQTKILDFG